MNIIKINDNSNKLFYIGGVVRDELLGRESLDVDITYVGNAIEYCSKFGEVVQVNPDFGTVRIAIPPLLEITDFGQTWLFAVNGSTECSAGSTPTCASSALSSQSAPASGEHKVSKKMYVDFASTRSESYPKKGHLPVVEKIGCSLKEDVMRRDFTINALAKSVTTGEIVDYVGGLEDLKNKKLRVLHDESFIDDPTRIIRGLKFATRFGFELEEHTKKLQDEYLANINYDMSYKRVKKELIETFQPYYTPHPSYGHPAWLFAVNGSTECSAGSTPTCASSALSSQSALPVGARGEVTFQKFIDQKIYKLVTPNDVEIPKVNVEGLVKKYCAPHPNPLPEGARGEEKPPRCSAALWLIYVGILGDLSRLPLTKIEQKILDDVPKEILKTDFELYKTFQNARIETILLYAILKDEVGARHYLDNLQNIKLEITGKDLQNLGIKPSPKYQEIFDEVLKAKLQNPKISKKDEVEIAKKLK